jgi:hypothetical protein
MTVWEGGTLFRRPYWRGFFWHSPLGVMASRRSGGRVAVSWRGARFPRDFYKL